MLHLRRKNSTSGALPHHPLFKRLHSKFPLERKTAQPFQIISLPQENGSFVASVVEAPEILVYARSRKAAESRAAKEFSKSSDAQAYRRHPLATTSAVTVDMEYDERAKVFVTYVKELHGMSTFGETESVALDNTVEMVRGYIQAMESHRKKIPLPAAKLARLKDVVRLT